jgi:hypothetical protein
MSVWRGVRASRATAVIAAAAAVMSLGLFLTLRSVPLVRAAWVDGVEATASDSVTSTPPPSPTADPCGGWDCAIQGRFSAAEAMVAATPGDFGIIVRDRVSNQVWQAGTPTDEIWTASTIKLAIAADLLVRARAGQFKITATIRGYLDDMLEFSANKPATTLWQSHGGTKALERYRSVFGMTGIKFPTSERKWGSVSCTAVDLAALMTFILDKTHPDDRAYLVDAMRTVHQVQRWGVYAAGAAQNPGNKNGWTTEEDDEGDLHWVTNSIGFAGPGERYIVSVMYGLPANPQAKGHTVDAGVHAVSNVVATVFGAKVPAPVPPNSMLLNPPTA